MSLIRIDSGDPNGRIVARAPALVYSKDGGIWGKNNDSYDDQGWEPFLLSAAAMAVLKSKTQEAGPNEHPVSP